MNVRFSILFAMAAVGFGQPPRSVWSGVYTQAQAKQGEAVYKSQCQGCHGQDLKGTGASAPLVSQVFLDLWREQELGRLYSYIGAYMPADDPGSLEEAENLALVAFLLARNGIPAGTAELTVETVDKVQLVGREGPRPLPAALMVRTLGCLVPVGNGWKLEAATPLRRFHPEAAVHADDVEDLESAPYGTAVFPLDEIPAKAAAWKGQRVEVRGKLAAGGRIRVQAAERVSAECEPEQ